MGRDEWGAGCPARFAGSFFENQVFVEAQLLERAVVAPVVGRDRVGHPHVFQVVLSIIRVTVTIRFPARRIST